MINDQRGFIALSILLVLAIGMWVGSVFLLGWRGPVLIILSAAMVLVVLNMAGAFDDPSQERR